MTRSGDTGKIIVAILHSRCSQRCFMYNYLHIEVFKYLQKFCINFIFTIFASLKSFVSCVAVFIICLLFTVIVWSYYLTTNFFLVSLLEQLVSFEINVFKFINWQYLLFKNKIKPEYWGNALLN